MFPLSILPVFRFWWSRCLWRCIHTHRRRQRCVGLNGQSLFVSQGPGNGQSKGLYLYFMFDQRRLDIIDQVEYGVHDRLHIYPLCGIFFFPWHRHQIEGTDGFWCLFQKTLAKWGKRNCQSFQAASAGLWHCKSGWFFKSSVPLNQVYPGPVYSNLVGYTTLEVNDYTFLYRSR